MKKVIKEYYDGNANKLYSTTTQVNGINHGPYKTYEPDGKAEITATYKNGKLNGLYTKYSCGKLFIKHWYVDGIIKATYCYDDGGYPYLLGDPQYTKLL